MTTMSPAFVRKPPFAKVSTVALRAMADKSEGAAHPARIDPQPAIKPTSRASRRAFTLVEIMVVVVLSGLILAGVMSTYIAVLKSSMRLWHYEKMEREANRGLETFARDARMARTVGWSNASQITLTVPRVDGSGTDDVTYRWNNGTKAFEQQKGGVTTQLVKDVQSFSFNYFNHLQQAAAGPQETHQIQVTMTTIPPTNGIYAQASKRVLSARYVLRN